MSHRARTGTPTRPANPPEDWLTFHLAHPEARNVRAGDPNCIFFWDGRYHLHYIYELDDVPGGGSRAAYAHVSSPDMVHWRWHPTTLTSERTGHGMYSGGGFLTADGRPAIIYHADPTHSNFVAVAEDDQLERWSVPELAVIDVRDDQDGSAITPWDPGAWREGDTFYAIFGGHPWYGGTATYFRSDDLKTWDYLGVVLDPDLPDAADDTDLSCPDFFPLGDKHMLLCMSHNRGCRYYLGEWKDEKFTPEFHGRMNWEARHLCAPESLLTPDGRRVMWAWIDIEAPQMAIQCLPRELDLPSDGILRIRPLRELEALREHERRVDGITVSAGEAHLVTGIAGDALELAVVIRPGTARRLGVLLQCDPQGAGGVSVEVDLDADTFSVGGVVAPLRLEAGDVVRLRIFLDKYLIEVFANDLQAIPFPHFGDADNVHVSVFAEDGDLECDLAGWRMRSIYAPAGE